MDTRLTLPAGTLLDGTYRIESVIGSGGFGITYRAEDMTLRTSVALKEYYPADFGERDGTLSVRPKSERHQSSFEWGRASFLREAQMLARFRHPSIVRVTRVFEAHSTAYMVMDFEQGQSFEVWLSGLGRPPTQAELDKITLPLLDALEAMHAKNSLHRDIAPDNILVRPDGSPVLVDFGSARRAVGEMSRSLTRIIKAGYSPSEQYAVHGNLQGPWTDLYALGGTLYRAVAGRAPEEATLRMSDDLMPSAAQAAGRGYRKSFLAAIDACLKVRHQDRPQSVAELRTLLLSPDRPSGRVAPRVAAQPARRRTPWAIAAAVVLLVLGGVYAAFELGRPVPGSGGGAHLTNTPTKIPAKVPAKTPAEADTGAAQAEQARRRRAEEERRQAAAAAAEREAKRKEIEQAEQEAALNTARVNAEAEAKARAEADAQAQREEEERVAAVRRAAEEQAAEAARLKKAQEERERLAALKKEQDARKKAEDDRRREEKAAAAKRRPNPLSYSGEVWGRGEIPHNQVVSRQTPHGVLSCRGGNLGTGAQRECWWQ